MRTGLLGALFAGALLVLFANPAFAVVGEVNVTDAGEEVPGATVTLEFDDGSTAVAQEDEDEPGVYYFRLTEDKANQTGTLRITKGDRTVTDRVNLARDGAPATFAGGVPGYVITRNIGGPPMQQAKGAPAAPGWVGTSAYPDSLQLSGGIRPFIKNSNRPDTNIVRHELGGQIVGFTTADNSSASPGIEGVWRVDTGGPYFGMGVNAGVELRANYFDTDAGESFDQIDNNGGNLAVFGPLPGGGAVTGNPLTNVGFTNEYSNFGLNVRVFKDYPIYGSLKMESFIGFRAGWTNVDETFTGTTAGVDIFSASSMDNEFYGPEVGFESELALCNCSWSVYGGGFANLNFNNVDVSRAMSLSTGATGADSFSEDTTTIGGGGSLGVRYRVGPATFSVGGQVEVNNTIPVININQQTGAATADIDDALDAMFGVEARLVY